LDDDTFGLSGIYVDNLFGKVILKKENVICQTENFLAGFCLELVVIF